MKYEKQILLKAIKADPYIIESASESMCDDMDVMMEVVRSCGYLLKKASPELRNIKKLVIQAVKNSTRYGALQWASDTLKDDKEVVLAAIEHYAYEIMHASDRLKLDRDIILALIGHSANQRVKEVIDRIENIKKIYV